MALRMLLRGKGLLPNATPAVGKAHWLSCTPFQPCPPRLWSSCVQGPSPFTSLQHSPALSSPWQCNPRRTTYRSSPFPSTSSSPGPARQKTPGSMALPPAAHAQASSGQQTAGAAVVQAHQPGRSSGSSRRHACTQAHPENPGQPSVPSSSVYAELESLLASAGLKEAEGEAGVGAGEAGQARSGEEGAGGRPQHGKASTVIDEGASSGDGSRSRRSSSGDSSPQASFESDSEGSSSGSGGGGGRGSSSSSRRPAQSRTGRACTCTFDEKCVCVCVSVRVCLCMCVQRGGARSPAIRGGACMRGLLVYGLHVAEATHTSGAMHGCAPSTVGRPSAAP